MNARRTSDVWLVGQCLHYIDPVTKVRWLKKCVYYEHRRYKSIRDQVPPHYVPRPPLIAIIKSKRDTGNRHGTD